MPDLSCALPFVKAVGRNKAPPSFKCVAKRWKSRGGFRPGINHAGRARGIFRPPRDQSPASERQLAARLLGILADDRNRLSRSDVVPGRPFFFAGHTFEMFFNDLLTPGKPVAPAHYFAFGRRHGIGAPSANGPRRARRPAGEQKALQWWRQRAYAFRT